MTELEARQRIQQFIDQLSVEELEEKIAPLDCQKKPSHPDCNPKTYYGGPQPAYGVDRYGGPF